MSLLSIQGIGCITPWGNGIHAVYEKSNKPNERMTSYVNDYDPNIFLKYRGIKHISKSAKMAISSTWLALQDCNDDYKDWNTEKVGVFVGNSLSYLNEVYEFLDVSYEEGADYVSPRKFSNTVLNNIPGWISIVFGIQGINKIIQTGVTSSIDAIEIASMYLNNGMIDHAIIIGVEEIGQPVMDSNCHTHSDNLTEASISMVLSREEKETKYGYVELLETWQNYEFNEQEYSEKLLEVIKINCEDLDYIYYGSGNMIDIITANVLKEHTSVHNICNNLGNSLAVLPLMKILLALKEKGNNLIVEANQIGNKGVMAVHSKGGV